ncbi:MAG: RidA family protein [Actinobacteria bacterium]|nr:RidA family protein [Actinomycetota bacterium]
MEKSYLNFEGSDPGQYGLSAGAVAGEVVFAGAMAIDMQTLKRPVAADTIAAETRLCIEDLAATLRLGGCGLEDLVKVNCYLSEDSYRGEFWATWDEVFAEVDAKIVRLTQVVGIAGDCRVELDGVAIRPAAG